MRIPPQIRRSTSMILNRIQTFCQKRLHTVHNAELGASCSIEKIWRGWKNTPKFLFKGEEVHFVYMQLSVFFSKIGDLLHEIKEVDVPAFATLPLAMFS